MNNGERCSANWDSPCAGKIGEELARCLAEHRKDPMKNIDPVTLARGLARMEQRTLDEDPNPEEGLAELLGRHLKKYAPAVRPKVEKNLRAYHGALTKAGASAGMALTACDAMVAKDLEGMSSSKPKALSEDVTDGPGDLPAAIAEVAAALAPAQRLEITMQFRAKFAELRKRLSAAQSRQEAANHAESIAQRMIGLLGPRRDDSVLDPNLIAHEREYLTAAEQLWADVQTRERTGKSYDVALAEAKAANPQLVESVAAGPVEREAPASAFAARDRMVELTEARVKAKSETFEAALEVVKKDNPELVSQVLAETR